MTFVVFTADRKTEMRGRRGDERGAQWALRAAKSRARNQILRRHLPDDFSVSDPIFFLLPWHSEVCASRKLNFLRRMRSILKLDSGKMRRDFAVPILSKLFTACNYIFGLIIPTLF